MFRFPLQTAMVIVVSASLLTATARSADEIEILNMSGQSKTPPQLYDYFDLDNALAAVTSNETILLKADAFLEYPIDDELVTQENGVTIKSDGYTIRITDVDGTGNEFEAVGHGLSEDDPIIFFGDTPTGIDEGVRYFVRSPITDYFSVSSTKTGNEVDISGNGGKLLFGMHHARIVPASSSTNYNYLLKIDTCNDVTIENITFDGKYSKNSTGYENGFKGVNTPGGAGRLLRIENCSGTNTLKGLHVANNRGKDSGGIDTTLAIGVHMIDCGTVNLTRCTGSRTGYNTWRTEGTDNVTYDYCRSENPHHRCIGEATGDTIGLVDDDTVSAIVVKNSDFIRDEPRETDEDIKDDEAYSLLGNINPKGVTLQPDFTMDNCFVDWRNAEGTTLNDDPFPSDVGYSWDFDDSPQTESCVLLKIEGLDTATFKNSKFLHGGNEAVTTKKCFTLKTDKDYPVEHLVIEDCEFSGAIFCGYNPTTNPNPWPLEELKLLGSKFQNDHHFNADAAIDDVLYKTFTIDKTLANSSTDINNVRVHATTHFGVFRIWSEDFEFDGSNWPWTFDHVEATTVTETGDTYFISDASNQGPVFTALVPNNVTDFEADNECRAHNGKFYISSQDLTDVDEN